LLELNGIRRKSERPDFINVIDNSFLCKINSLAEDYFHQVRFIHKNWNYRNAGNVQAND